MALICFLFTHPLESSFTTSPCEGWLLIPVMLVVRWLANRDPPWRACEGDLSFKIEVSILKPPLNCVSLWQRIPFNPPELTVQTFRGWPFTLFPSCVSVLRCELSPALCLWNKAVCLHTCLFASCTNTTCSTRWQHTSQHSRIRQHLLETCSP